MRIVCFRKTDIRAYLILAGAFTLSACGVEGLGALPTEEAPTAAAANPDTFIPANGRFTAENLEDGSLLLDWPRDPRAVKYVVVINGEIIAEISSATLSFVLVDENVNLANSVIQILSLDADNTLTPWVLNPQIVTEPDAENPEVPISATPSTDEESNNNSENNNQPLSPTTEEQQEIDVPGTEANVDEEQLVTSENPGQAQQPVQSETPAEGETTPEQTSNNLAPRITDTSYNCDPVIEAVAFNVGDTDTFTLSVDDESPLTLTFAADSSDSETVEVVVNSNGVYTVSALKAGESYLWLTAEDENGLVDEYELWVVVD